MTGELEKEAEEWLNKWELCNKCDHKVQCIEDNAICLQVVERAYLASAEPREKQIQIDAEQIRALQKQNGELTDKVKELEKHNEELIALINAERERQEKCDDVHLRKIAELEKENAELSMKRKAERKIFQGIVEKKNDQLTKAKEIIKELLSSCFGYNSKTVNYEVKAKAEQFLKEIEE